MHIHTCIQIHVYTWRSSNEKTDLLAVSARNAGQGLQKAAGACSGSVGGKGVQKEAKGEKEREESGSEAKKAIRSPQPSVEKNSDRGEIVSGSLEILTPFPSCCFFFFNSFVWFSSGTCSNYYDSVRFYYWILSQARSMHTVDYDLIGSDVT